MYGTYLKFNKLIEDKSKSCTLANAATMRHQRDEKSSRARERKCERAKVRESERTSEQKSKKASEREREGKKTHDHKSKDLKYRSLAISNHRVATIKRNELNWLLCHLHA